jgi:hypothetical protein
MGENQIEILDSKANFKEWDAFNASSPQGSVFSYSWWLKTVCDERFKIILYRNGSGIVCGLPIVTGKKGPFTVSMMPRYTQTLGPIFQPFEDAREYNKTSTQIEALNAIIPHIPRYSYLNMRCHHSFTNIMPFIWSGYSSEVRFTYLFDDLSDIDRIYAGITSKYRNKISKAQNSGVEVHESDDIETFIETIRISLPGDIFNGSAEIIRKLDGACRQYNARRLYFAADPSGQIHSTLFVVYDQHCTYNLIQGGDLNLRKSGANILTMWQSIQDAAGQSGIYDFEGSMLPNIEIVFRSFGAVQKPYYTLKKYAGMGFLNRTIQFIKKLF